MDFLSISVKKPSPHLHFLDFSEHFATASVDNQLRHKSLIAEIRNGAREIGKFKKTFLYISYKNLNKKLWHLMRSSTLPVSQVNR
jgi:hypothetical protein